MNDQELAEETVETGLQYLRSGDLSSVFSRNKWRKLVKNELTFLRNEHPDSYLLSYDLSDVSLELERA